MRHSSLKGLGLVQIQPWYHPCVTPLRTFIFAVFSWSLMHFRITDRIGIPRVHTKFVQWVHRRPCLDWVKSFLKVYEYSDYAFPSSRTSRIGVTIFAEPHGKAAKEIVAPWNNADSSKTQRNKISKLVFSQITPQKCRFCRCRINLIQNAFFHDFIEQELSQWFVMNNKMRPAAMYKSY